MVIGALDISWPLVCLTPFYFIFPFYTLDDLCFIVKLIKKWFVMLLHNSPLLRIYFGDAKDKIFPDEYLNIPPEKNLFDIPTFVKLKEAMRLDRILFPLQVHGVQGFFVSSKTHAKKSKSFTTEADFLITNSKFTGLGVMTADCLPVVLFDTFNQAIANVHAGWRSSVKHIVLRAIDAMTKEFGTKPEHLKVFFGPSAKVCCYKVGEDLVEQIEDIELIDRVVQRRGDDIFFDLPGFNQLLLESVGVKPEAFKFDYNTCTVCDDSFCSYRRQGEKACRQMTVVSLQ